MQHPSQRQGQIRADSNSLKRALICLPKHRQMVDISLARQSGGALIMRNYATIEQNAAIRGQMLRAGPTSILQWIGTAGDEGRSTLGVMAFVSLQGKARKAWSGAR